MPGANMTAAEAVKRATSPKPSPESRKSPAAAASPPTKKENEVSQDDAASASQEAPSHATQDDSSRGDNYGAFSFDT